ncbi:MAG: biotin--[acetyl-CoA-carboxylase] ligase [Acidiferrobacterales bacterium]
MSASLDIPSLYDLIVYDKVDSVVEEAKRLAARGAEEGTLIWAKEQTAASGRFGRPWISLPGNLHCALILRIEEPAAVVAQLSFVAAVSLAAAISNLSLPLIELRYRWPNDVLLYDAKVAGISLTAPSAQEATYEWLVLGTNVNIESAPENLEPCVTSLRGEGASETKPDELLEVFTRHFLSWINRWAEEGFAALHKAWSIRPHGIGETITVRLAAETLEGRFAELDEEGALVMEMATGEYRRITLREFFAV